MKPKLSFIVPVYNVEPYLRKCVDSLIAQDYDSYEIILVDDGSPDGCPAICDEYVRMFDNIHVVHQENAGLSAARNAGLNEAKGEYVCFVDSDDYWEENVLGGLMEQVEREQLDVLRFDYRNVRIVNSEERIVNSGAEGVRYEVTDPNKYPHPVDMCADVVTGERYLNERMFYTCYAVMYIMRREIVPNFTEGIHFEDVDWFPRMMLQAKRVNATQTIVYNYLIRQGSITQVKGNKEKIRKNVEDNLFVLNTLTELKKQHPNCVWLANMVGMIVSGVLATVATNFYEERNSYIERLRTLHVFPLTIANQGSTYRKRAKLINLIGPKLYCLIMSLRK